MPGVDLNLDLPTPNDPFVTALAKIVAAFVAIEEDLEPRIGAGSLDIDTELSMNGAALTNVGGVRLQNGESAVVGTLYMDEEFHVVTTAGDVQLTLNGVLNVTALGTIGGDYGGFDPANVTFVTTSDDYFFRSDATTFADVQVRDIILNGAAGTFRLGVDAGLSGDQEIRFKSVPVTGHGMFAFNSADNSLVDAAGVVPVVGGMTFGANIDIGNNKILHGQQTITVPIALGDCVNLFANTTAQVGVPGVALGSNESTYIRLPPLRAGERIISVKVNFSDNSLNNTNVYLNVQAGVGASGWPTVLGNNLAVGFGSTSATVTPNLGPAVPYVVLVDRPVWVLLQTGVSGICKPCSLTVTTDVIA